MSETPVTPESTDAAPPRSASSRRSWAGLWLPTVLLPTLVMLPLLAQPLVADHRFNIFANGGRITRAPWEVVTGPIASIPNYLDHGNFRPLGRMVEQGQDFLVLTLSRVTDLPIPVALRVVSLVFVALLAVAAVLLAETVSQEDPVLSRAPSAVAPLAALAVPTVLVSTGGSAAILYTSLYFASAALVLLVACAAARRAWFDRRAVGIRLYVGATVVGGSMAAFNEITYIAVPLAVVTVAVRGLVTLRMRPRELLGTASARVVAAAAGGFFAVLLPVRAVIAGRCADQECYAASDLSLGADALPALVHRVLSTLPPASWSVSGAYREDWWPGTDLVLLAGHLLIAVLVVWTGRLVLISRRPGPRAVPALALTGAALLLGSSTAMALTTAIQQLVVDQDWPVGHGWRDLGLAAAGGSLLAATLGSLLVRSTRPGRLAGWIASTAFVGVLGLVVMTSFGVNAAVVRTHEPDQEELLLERISEALLHPEDSTDAQRCAMLEEFTEIYPGNLSWQERLASGVSEASHALHGAAFCVSAEESVSRG